MDQPPSVFVLMPFDESFADVYTYLIKAPLESLGFNVTRADSLFNQQQILKDVVKGIADASLVVADVTDLNENVLYELGLAHALGKRVVMITQRLDQLPFDLRPYRANEYSTQFNRADQLKDLLSDVGQAVLNGSAEFSNPVQDFAPYALGGSAQVSVNLETMGPSGAPPAPGASASGAGAEGPAEDSEEPGLLEQMIALQRGGEVATKVSEQIGELTANVGAMLEAHTERLNRANASLGDRAAGAQLAIARDVARELGVYADALGPLTTQLRESLSDMASGANTLAREGRIVDDGDANAAQELIDSLREAEQGLSQGRVATEEFAQTMSAMPNVDRVLTRATKRAARAVAETAEEIQNGEAEFARARGLLEERLQAYRDVQ